MINNGQIALVGGNYDIDTGTVEFFDDCMHMKNAPA